MGKSVRLVISIMSLMLVILLSNLLMAPSLGKTGLLTVETRVEADTYISSQNPSSNYGGQNYLYSGERYNSDNEIYFRFNFSDMPSNWEKAEISFHAHGIYETNTVDVYLLEQDWGEYTLTWSNKTAKSTKIARIYLADDGRHAIDISDHVKDREAISVCLTHVSPEDKSFYVYSREYTQGSYSYYSDYETKLIWTHEAELTISVTSPSASVTLESGYNDIKWTSLGAGSSVDIDLYKGNSHVEQIEAGTDNDGSHDNWYLSSSDGYWGNDYRIKITDSNDPEIYGYSKYFTIFGTGSSVDPNELTDPSNYVDPSLPPSLSILIIILILIGIIGVAAVSISMVRRKWEARKSKAPKPAKKQDAVKAPSPVKPPKPPKPQVPVITEATTRFCPNCGTDIVEGETICEYCGSDLT